MKKTLLALALLGASSTAMADSWIYGGASVGQSDYEGKHVRLTLCMLAQVFCHSLV